MPGDHGIFLSLSMFFGYHTGFKDATWHLIPCHSWFRRSVWEVFHLPGMTP